MAKILKGIHSNQELLSYLEDVWGHALVEHHEFGAVLDISFLKRLHHPNIPFSAQTTLILCFQLLLFPNN